MSAEATVYGSERHLLRYLGRHRAEFDRRVLDATGGEAIDWLDFPFEPTRPWLDGEWKGLDFLPAGHPGRVAWSGAWPARGNAPNWDAVARLRTAGGEEWLLVEAKAHLGELASACAADAERGGRRRIAELMARVREALGAAPDRDWLNGYYQMANRLAVLHVLGAAGVPARLLFIYFTGDTNPHGVCPADAAGWADALAAQDRHLGLRPDHSLAGRVHRLFLEVAPVASAARAVA